jgi:hypothetical protein
MYLTSIDAHERRCPENPENQEVKMTEEKQTTPSTGDIIRQMVEVRDERRAISSRDKELVESWRSLEMELLIRLDDQGMSKASVDDVGTATITTQILPQVVDWDALFAHIQDEGAFHLLQRRPAAAAFRELHGSGEVVPGIEPYEQRSISLRKS